MTTFAHPPASAAKATIMPIGPAPITTALKIRGRRGIWLIICFKACVSKASSNSWFFFVENSTSKLPTVVQLKNSLFVSLSPLSLSLSQICIVLPTYAIARFDFGFSCRLHSHCQGLHQRPLIKAYVVRELVCKLGRVNYRLAQRAVSSSPGGIWGIGVEIEDVCAWVCVKLMLEHTVGS